MGIKYAVAQLTTLKYYFVTTCMGVFYAVQSLPRNKFPQRVKKPHFYCNSHT